MGVGERNYILERGGGGALVFYSTVSPEDYWRFYGRLGIRHTVPVTVEHPPVNTYVYVCKGI